MKIDELYQVIESPPPTYLSQALAVCYVLSVLLQRESYGVELIQRLEIEHPHYRLSDTILYSALKFLKSEKAITDYWYKAPGRGRPRRMFRVNPFWQDNAKAFAYFWHQHSLLAKHQMFGKFERM
jgi:DNA-binding PadR family transcriptional regulator